MTGAYGSYKLWNSGAQANIGTLKSKLVDGGFNTVKMSIKDQDINNLDSVLSTLGDSVKTILEDRYWGPSTGQLGIHSLTYGNYLKMEAEYKYTFDEISGAFTPDLLTTTLDPTGMGDVYNYIFAHDASCGGRIGPGATSNQYTWVCDETSGDEAGLALSNPRFRWTVPGHTYPRSIGNDLKFNIAAITGNRLYLTVAMKFSGLSAGEEVATIKLKVLRNVANWTEFQDYINNPNLNNPNNYYEFVLHPVNSEVDTTIYNNPYSSVPRDDIEYGRNFLFEYYIEFPDPEDQASNYDEILVRAGAGDFFRHINPEIEWHGNGRMEIDYIVLEDHYHRQARLYGSSSDELSIDVLSMLKERLQQIEGLPNSSNISYYYTKDEPFQGQFSMYDKVESFLENEPGLEDPKIITAINLNDYKITKPNGNSYDHYLNFLAQAKPHTIAVDAYPLQEWDWAHLIMWNNDTHPFSVQKKIDEVVAKTYKKIAHAVRYNSDLNVRETEIIYIPQIFGEYVTNSEGDVHHWRYFKPPKSMNKCLQLLPLCYSADGILDYTLLAGDYLYGEVGSQYYRKAPLMHGIHYAGIHDPDDDSAFEHLTEANQKIATYGPYLREQNWIDADCLMTYGGNDGVNVSPFLLTDLRVLDPNTPPPGGVPPVPWFYDGYVQCGYYKDDLQSPSFMLVNRRAVRKTVSESAVVQLPVDDYFQDAPSQTVIFVPSTGAVTQFGTHIGLFDPFDGQLYRKEGADIRVSIGPGDGKMLEMVGTIPHEVSVNSNLSTKSVIVGAVSILPGVNVVTNSGTTTRIMSNSVINIGDGASYTLRGIVTIEDGVSIVVSQNGSLIFDNASCTWGQGSKIEVNGGSLTINGGSMNDSNGSPRWAGIRAAGSNLVTISDAIISNADHHEVFNSNLLISNSRFNIPANSWGLLLKNSITGYQTEIINTEPGRGFYGTSNLTSKGIYLYTMKNPAYISNVDFQNLNYGIFKSAIPYATDSVSECNFVNCDTGIRLCNNENGTDIQQCSFANNQTGKQGTGIQLVASSPTISTSNFTNLYRGILTEFALISGIGMESSVTESNFYNCEMGVESRSSNHRLKANYFNRNNSGIVNHAGSNLNLSYDANNVLMNHNDNIVFYDTMPYESTIQLFTGHNDFYHLTDSSTSISAIDFSFDTNYYNFPITPDFKINASKNWFQDDQVTFNNQAYVDYVYVDIYDPSASMPAPPPESDRLFIALGYESQELYELACATYQAIIDDQLEEEQTYVTSAIDGLYRCTKMIPNPAWELTDYFDTKALQYAIDDPTLSAILKDYLAKVFVLNKDFQAAVDLIQLRIDNPISEIDSLRAVLDLEIVLQLAAMEEDKRPLTTKYAQYQYPDIQVFDVMHSNNWDRYNRALRQNDPETNSVIAPTPQIQSNYPNPFNPSTTIAFSIPETGRVRVSVYNIKGQKVKDLLNTEMTRGNHRLVWDGRDTNNRNVASGIYFIKLESGGKTSIRKAMLMK